MSESVNAEEQDDLVNIQDDPAPVEVPAEPEPPAEEPEVKSDSSYLDFSVVPEEHRKTFEMRTNADYRKIKTLERKQNEALKKLKDYEDKLAEASKPQDVALPSTDDWYNDPDAAQARMQAALEAKANSAKWEAEQQQRQQQYQAEIEKQKVERFESFAQRAGKAGMKPERLATAAMVLDKALPEDHQQYLIDHEYGPQLLNALASDPVELADLANLSPYQVGVKLDKMSQAFRKKTKSNTPPPEDPIQGNAVNTDEYGGLLQGSKFV